MYSLLDWRILSNSILSLSVCRLFLKMTIIITGTMKDKRNKITLLLYEKKILRVWCAGPLYVLACQMKLISNFIRTRSFSTKAIETIIFQNFFFFSHYNIFWSLPRSNTFYFLILKHHLKTNLQYCILKEIQKNHFVKHPLVQTRLNNPYILGFVYKC